MVDSIYILILSWWNIIHHSVWSFT